MRTEQLSSFANHPAGSDRPYSLNDSPKFYGHCFLHSIQPVTGKPSTVQSIGSGTGPPRHITGIRFTGVAVPDTSWAGGSLPGLWVVAQHGRSNSGRLASIPADSCLCPNSHRSYCFHRCQCHSSGTATYGPCVWNPHIGTENRNYLAFFDRVNPLLAGETNILS
jgi:hypothetical protein